MQIRDIENYCEKAKTNHIAFAGFCHDCKEKVVVNIDLTPAGLEISGGAAYKVEDGTVFLKCDKCFKEGSALRNYNPCEVYSRVVGYLRPISQWNNGKRQEFEDRKNFVLGGKNVD
jgi:hypothetical protein